MTSVRAIVTFGVAAALAVGGISVASGATTSASAAAPSTAAAPTGLRVEGQSSEALVGTATPRLAWAPQDTGRGESQTAYEVRVVDRPSNTDSDSTQVWDSARVASPESTGIGYAGPALQADHTYAWSVRTWNSQDQASPWSDAQTFDVGPIEVGDWDASWLRVDDGALTRSTVTLDQPVARARLYVGVQGVIEPSINGEPVAPGHSLNNSTSDYATRVLYRDYDVTSMLHAGKNAVGASLGLGSYTGGKPTFVEQLSVTYVDGTRATFGTDDSWVTHAGPVTVDDFYYGETYDARRLPQGWDTADFDASTWSADTVVAPVAGLPDVALHGAVTSSDHLTTAGWSPEALVDGTLISTDGSQGFHSEIATSANSAKWVQVDLGSSTRLGDVELYPAHPTNDTAGDYPAAGFPVRYQVLVSDDPTFATSAVFADRSTSDQPSPGDTPVRLTGDATGRYVRVAASVLNGRNGGFTLRFAELAAHAVSGTPSWGYSRLEADSSPAERIVADVHPVTTTQLAGNVTVVDFGTDYTGQVTLTASAPSGTTAVVTKGEMLDGSGRVSTENIKFAATDPTRQKDTYIFDGSGKQSFTPALNFAGFRYAEVTGLPVGTDVTLTARVINNDVDQTGSFTTSDPVLNGIQQAVVRTQLNDLQQGEPVDSAQREKHGWLGDAGVTDVEAMSNFDLQSLYDEWLGSIRTSQDPSGAVYSVAPRQGRTDWFPEPSWGSAYPQIVWHSYQQYGDASVLRENYDGVKAWVEYLGTISTDHIIDPGTPSWGDDWQATAGTPHQYFQTASYLWDAQLLSQMADALGKDADAATYADLAGAIATAFNTKWFDASSEAYGNGSQFSNAFPLALGIVPAAHTQGVLGNLVADVKARGNHVSSGFAGTAIVYDALGRYGRNDVLLDVAQNTDYPSFGYMVANGPGTIWEKWVDSSSPDGTSSKSHIGLAGSIGQWYYQQLAGIQPGEPGYRTFTLAPAVVGDLKHVAVTQETVRGTIASAWTRTGDDLDYRASVPVGSTATVELPATSVVAVTESGHALAGADGVTVVSSDGTTVTLRIGSGDYDFAVNAHAETAASAVETAQRLLGTVADLRTAGDLTDGAAASLSQPLGAVVSAASSAIELFGHDDDAATAQVLTALDQARAAQAALAGAAVPDAARSALATDTTTLVATLTDLAAQLTGLTVTVDAGLTGSVTPGTAIDAAVTLTNSGHGAVTGISLAPQLPDGWSGGGTVSVPDLAAGATRTAHVHATVGEDQLPGDVSVPLPISFTYAGTHLTSTTSVPVAVSATAAVSAVSFDTATVAPNSSTVATVTVTNTGEQPITGAAHVQVPDGWVAPLAAPTVRIAPGATVTQHVTVFVPTTLSTEDENLTGTFERGGVTLAARSAQLPALVTTPPAASLDHVDLGDSTSETLHDLVASPGGGTSPEGGLTRRYAGTGTNTSFEFSMKVPKDAPFVLSAIETFDRNALKQYDVSVDGVVVQHRLFQRTIDAAGVSAYQILVDDPAALSSTGTATIRFTHPANGNYDPSIADTWTSAAPTTHPAPDAQARLAPAVPDGSAGWYRTAPALSVVGQDSAGTALTHLAYRLGEGAFTTYDAPVSLSQEGTTHVEVQGQADGVTSPDDSITVRLDSVAPVTSATQTGSPTATITLAATDATSGVAATEYRIGDGTWQRYVGPFTVPRGASSQTIGYRSTDQAGNVEVAQSLALGNASSPGPVGAPTITGSAVVAHTVTATDGVWSGADGAVYTYQWLRNGQPIPGAVARTYEVVAADAGTMLAVRVTAAVPGAPPASALSAGVAVSRNSSTVTLKLKHATRQRVRGTAVVTVRAPGVSVTGRVLIRSDGRTVAVGHLSAARHGRLTVRLPRLTLGKHRVKAVYEGAPGIAGATSHTVKVRIRR